MKKKKKEKPVNIQGKDIKLKEPEKVKLPDENDYLPNYF